MVFFRSSHLAIVLAGALCACTALPRAPLEPVTTVEGVTEYRLANGLKVLLVPDVAASTFSVHVAYRVGLRHGGVGESGMAHLLEHMLFKGTRTGPNVFQSLDARGAQIGGTTSFDYTTYDERLAASAENLEFALRLEADRMRNGVVRAEELATQIPVVLNELEIRGNDAYRSLLESMLGLAYRFHGYGRSMYHNRSDIERASVAGVQAFYSKYYRPDNALLAVAGRFEPRAALALIQKHFGTLPRPERELAEESTIEPAQDGARRVEVYRPEGTSSHVGVLYHVPAATHPDAQALRVLAQVLAARPSGRLYETLVSRTRTASEVSAQVFGLRDPGWLWCSARLNPGQNPTEGVNGLILEVQRLAGTVAQDEVDRARNLLRNAHRATLRDSREMARALIEAESVGDWRFFFIGRDRLDSVTPADVNRVARTYLTPGNRTAGLFGAIDRSGRSEIPPAPGLTSTLESYRGSDPLAEGEPFEATAQNIERATERASLGGIALALLPRKSRGQVVHARMRLSYGSEESLRGREGAAELLGPLLLRGTSKRDYQGLLDAFAALDTAVSVSSYVGQVDLTLTTTRPNLRAALELIGEMLRTPSFPALEIELARDERLAEQHGSTGSAFEVVRNALTRAIAPLPPGHPFRVATLEERIERTSKVTREEIVRLHERFLGAGHALATFVGDFDPAEVKGALESLSRWTSPEPYARIETPLLAVESVEPDILDLPGDRTALVGRGSSFRMRSSDPDYPALDLASYVLGGAQASRLFSALREQAGVSYAVDATFDVAHLDDASYLTAYATTSPQQARRTQDLLRAEFTRWLEQPIPEDELARFRGSYAEAFQSKLGDDAWLADALLGDLRLGRTFTFREQVVQRALQLSGEELQAALRTHLGSATFVDLVAGDASVFAAVERESVGSARPDSSD